jgi:Zn-dependent protease
MQQYSPMGVAFFVLYWVVFIYSIVLHEIAHGYSSLQLGDDTALKAGRFSLNPLRHIDPLYSIIMPVVFFIGTGAPWGGAKPVPTNPYAYRSVRWGSLMTALAGPLTNLGLALCFALLFFVFRLVPGPSHNIALQFLVTCMLLNLFLAAFNLLPVPPLDGSHILGSLLPRAAWDGWGKIQSLGWLPMIALVIVNNRVFPFIGYFLDYVGLRALTVLGGGGAGGAAEWQDAFWASNLLKGGG